MDPPTCNLKSRKMILFLNDVPALLTPMALWRQINSTIFDQYKRLIY
jgi:hypothetical protein